MIFSVRLKGDASEKKYLKMNNIQSEEWDLPQALGNRGEA